MLKNDGINVCEHFIYIALEMEHILIFSFSLRLWREIPKMLKELNGQG